MKSNKVVSIIIPVYNVMPYIRGDTGSNLSGSVVVRPSGTEPELKTYISVTAEDRTKAESVEKLIQTDLNKVFGV